MKKKKNTTTTRAQKHTNSRMDTIDIESLRPTKENLDAYLTQFSDLDFTADDFLDYYDSVGWEINGKVVRDWQAAVRLWARNAPRFLQVKKRQKARAQQTGQQKVPVQAALLLQARQAQQREQAQQEWNRRYEESRQNAVTYEEYKRMKAAGLV